MFHSSRSLYWIAILVLCSCATNNSGIISGTLTMGHEVRSFVPDGQNKEYWVLDKSDELYNQYQKIALKDNEAYIPVKAQLKVIELPKMQEGFGAEYDGTYEVVEIISITPIKK